MNFLLILIQFYNLSCNPQNITALKKVYCFDVFEISLKSRQTLCFHVFELIHKANVKSIALTIVLFLCNILFELFQAFR
jgi:hypothetical protein